MKLYQIIAFAILSVMYTATIFGPDPALPYVPKDICDLIDEFCGGENKNREQELNDRYYKETGHLKPYSRLLNLLMSLTMEKTEQKFPKNISQYAIFYTSIFAASFILSLILSFNILPKIFPTLYKTFSGMLLASISLNFLLVPPVALSTSYIAAKITERLGHSHLITKSPTKIIIRNIDINILSRQSENIMEKRSLYNIQSGLIFQPSKGALKIFYSLTRPKAELPYKLNNGKIDTYLSNDYSPLNDPSKNNYKPGDKLRSLSTPVDLVSLDVSRDKNIIVALDEKGSLYKWELLNRPSLHEIMNSE